MQQTFAEASFEQYRKSTRRERRKKRGREAFLDEEESVPVEEGICHVAHVSLREGLPTTC